MKVYWNDRSKKAEILEDIEKDGAKPWASKEPQSDILIGAGRIFIYPSDYRIDGCSLSIEDLEALLKKLRDKSPA